MPLKITASQNIIVDHCTMQWGQAYNFNVSGKNITFSNNIIGSSLNENSSIANANAQPYGGMINTGSERITFAKNFMGDAAQRAPRFVDSDYIDIYNNVFYNYSVAVDLYYSSNRNINFKSNIRNNYFKRDPVYSGQTRARVYRSDTRGGNMLYFDGNYVNVGSFNGSDSLHSTLSSVYGYKNTLKFGATNGSAGAYDLSNVSLDDWFENPASYLGETAANGLPFVYADYPVYSLNDNVMDVLDGNGGNNLLNYSVSDKNIGANRPTRDLYDTMTLAEIAGGLSTSASLEYDEVAAYFTELEKHTGMDFGGWKNARSWTVRGGEGPVMSAASSSNKIPLDWDNYTDLMGSADKYKYTTDFEIGDWWGEYCGAPGQRTIYTLRNAETGETVNTTNAEYDESAYTLESSRLAYVPVQRTVADLYPDDVLRQSSPEAAEFMDSYRALNYTGASDSDEISWDSMGDGIPDWYKEYRGLGTSEDLSKTVNPDTGYTYLEEYLWFMAGDKQSELSRELLIENFKVNKIGCSSAQVFWNTNFGASCTIEYGTEPGSYPNKAELKYSSTLKDYSTYHSQMLTGLEPDTTYYYKVTAEAPDGSIISTEYNQDDLSKRNMTFTTAAAPGGWDSALPEKPVITDVKTGNGQATLNWSGNIDFTDSYTIYYDTAEHGSDYSLYQGKIEGISAAETSYTISGLTEGKKYYFVVSAVNKNGETSSDTVTGILNGLLLDYDFTNMSDAEKEEFMIDNDTYIRGGTVDFAEDPDTGKEALSILDEVNAFRSSVDFTLPYAQDGMFTIEMSMKVLYQKQNNVFNHQSQFNFVLENEPINMFLKLFRDDTPAEDLRTDNSSLWSESASVDFQCTSTPLSVTDGRLDGTRERGSILISGNNAGSYTIGLTEAFEEGGDRVLPPNLVYDESEYRNTTVYGDAKYELMDDKMLHGIWYYLKGSSEYLDYKIVVDPENSNIKIYENGIFLGEGEFDDTELEPCNIGKVGLHTENDGYGWINLERIRAYTGDTFAADPSATVAPGSTPTPTPTPRPTLRPTPTPRPTATPTAIPTTTPNATPYPTLKPGMVTQVYEFSSDDFEGLENLPADTEVGGITVSKSSDITDSNKEFSRLQYPDNSGREYTKRLKMGTASLWFKVPGTCSITVDAVSANSSQSRSYSVYAGETKLGEFTCIPDEYQSYTVNYTGDAAEISIVPNAGINLYGIIVVYDEEALQSPEPIQTLQPTETPVPTLTPTPQPVVDWSIDGYENGVVKLKVPTDTEDGKKLHLFIANISQDNMLTECEAIEVTVEQGRTDYDITTNKGISGENVKIMLWDDALMPLTGAYITE